MINVLSTPSPGNDAQRHFALTLSTGSVYGLMVTMVACFLPHTDRLPLWMPLLAAICVIYRLLIHFRNARHLHGSIKIVLAGLCTWLLLEEYGTLMAPDGAVAFLLLAYFLKLMEMNGRRDAMFLMLLSFFVIPMNFLYHSHLTGALWVFLCFILAVSTLISFHRTPAIVPDQKAPVSLSFQAPLAAVRLMAFSLPLTVFLFLVLPRLAPLWQMPSAKASVPVGLSDRLDTHKLGELFRSGKVAFRAEFIGETPDRSQLYWRGPVMERFDGASWSVVDELQTIHPVTESPGDTDSYRVYLQPTHQRYVFVLSPLAQISGIATTIRPNGMVTTEKPIVSPLSYHASFAPPGALMNASFAQNLLDNAVLPEQVAPRTRRMSHALYDRADQDIDRFVHALTTFFAAETFFYTLAPPPVSGDTTDDFVFRTRAGYCSHYANAAAVMLRSVGIPARIVAGYQGGEYQPMGNYWIVHQYDAHAWVEYFHPQRGWSRFDPTAAVSPARLAQGMEPLSWSVDGLRLESFAIHQWPILRELRRTFDYLNYQWIINVVEYRQQERDRWLSSWFGNASPGNWLPWFVGVVMGSALLSWLFLTWRERSPRQHPLDAAILRAIGKASVRFRDRFPGETVAAYCIAYGESGAEAATELLWLSEEYHRLRYGCCLPPRLTETAPETTAKLVQSIVEFRRRARHFK